jgi:hypothetical protein
MEKFKTLNTLNGSVKHFDELVGVDTTVDYD